MHDSPYDGIIGAWQVGTPQQIVRPGNGTVNMIVKITIDGREYFLRAYRHPDRAPREHAVIAHARAHDFPAVAPLPLPDGTTLLDRDGQRYALFPGATGRQYARDALTTTTIAAMGGNLAALHLALHDYPHAQARRVAVEHDRDATLATITHLEQVIRRRDGTDPRDRLALARLDSRRIWLEQHDTGPRIDPTIFNEQLIHGDYQETNLFFGDDQVCAVIDWDQTYLASRAWEIMRVLDFVYAFRPEPCALFLTAYRATQQLTLEELDRAAMTYSHKQAHNLWVYEAYYLEDNERVGQFITPGGFIPPAERWAQLRPHLIH
ncbi:MAG TPA: phosphotransferase [Thermomicrobiales bacterium]|jgi:homoserine kinase type II